MHKSSLLRGAALGVVLAIGMGAAAQAQDLGVAWKGAPEFSNDDVKFKVRGRVYMDYVAQDVDGEFDAVTNPGGTGDYSSSNSRIRTARIGVEGQWNSNWAYKAEFNVTGGSAVWEDLILEYKPNDTTSVMLGNFKTLSLENITSSRYTTFMERGAFNDIIDAGRVTTAAVKVNGANWTALAAVSGDSINNADVALDERTSIQGRVTFAPIDSDTTKLHLGAWGRYREFNDEGLAAVAPVPAGGGEAGRYRVRNNTNVGDRFTDSGSNFGESDQTLAAEAALVWNSFSVQGEYARINVDKRCTSALICSQGADEGTIDAFYAYASWFPTGETRRYEANKGEFGRTKILNPVTAGGTGAWELGVRYDSVDLTDLETVRVIGGVDTLTPLDRGGEYSAVTLGANWYPFPYVRFMANYSMAENDNPTIPGSTTNRDVEVDTLQFRAQFDF